MAKVSTHLGRKATTAIKQSFRTAAAIDRPLNTYVTINIMQTEAPEEETSARFLKLRERRFGRWASYTPKGAKGSRNGPPTDVWVIEAPNGHAHIHWVLHVDPTQQDEFEKKLVRGVESALNTCLCMIPDPEQPTLLSHILDSLTLSYRWGRVSKSVYRRGVA